jgi:[ribosomal protein S18]-alanine N-acetyltransferase
MFWYLPFGWGMTFWDEMLRGPAVTSTELAEVDLDAAAEIHAQAFSQAWSGDEFAALLGQDGVFGFAARRVAAPDTSPLGIVLARLAVDEAEILTVAVSPAARGKGVGRLLMDAVLERLHAERANALFLEVEETNVPALALYRRLRFEEVGRRPAYYAGTDGKRTSALILKRALRPA